LSILNIIYLLVKYFIKTPDINAPTAAPIGKSPTSHPNVEVYPANYPKYFLKMFEFIADIILRHNP
jgi:hypothetical protein